MHGFLRALSLLILAVTLGCGDNSGNGEAKHAPLQPGDQAGASAANVDGGAQAGLGSVRGSCPEGYGCIPIAVEENRRYCIPDGELFAPSCKVAADCEHLPGSICRDPGLDLGMFCALTCTP